MIMATITESLTEDTLTETEEHDLTDVDLEIDEEFDIESEIELEHEDEIININTIKIVPNEERVTCEFLNKFETARILATRIAMIEKGAIPLVNTEDTDNTYEIAKKELVEGKLPFIIRRKIGLTKVEIWKLNELKVNHMILF